MTLRQNTERKKYEGRGEKRRRETRTDETRKWDEGPRGEVERNEWRPSLPRLYLTSNRHRQTSRLDKQTLVEFLLFLLILHFSSCFDLLHLNTKRRESRGKMSH